MASLEILTDEAIIDYTRRGNKNFILTNHQDLNTRFKYPFPIRGGVYDPEIFGSAYEDRCYCGKLRSISNEPCPECGARVLTKEESLRRFGRIELPFYYLNSLRFPVFKDFIDDLFSDSRVITKFDKDPSKLGYNSSGSRRLNQKVYDSCQFEYDAATKELTITNEITDESHCSYEGLMRIISENFPDKLSQYKDFINRLYLVLPTYMRPPSFTKINGRKSLGVHKMTVWYQIVLRLCCSANYDAKDYNYDLVMKRLKSPAERVGYTALLRALLSYGRKETTELLNTSKENLARGLYSLRVKNSLRCPIVPSTELPIDEVIIPRHLAYEICRSQFIKFLMEQYNFTEEQATISTKVESDNPELQKAFDEFVNGNPAKGIPQQCVIINRPPSLHEYSLIGLKMRVPPYGEPDYAMHLPINKIVA